MLKKHIIYTDYNGVEKKEDHYFNLTEAEITQFQWGVKGGLIETLKQAIKSEDSPVIMDAFEKLIDKSYGVKTVDGKFKKTKEALDDFKSTPAYSQLFMDILTKPEAMDEFTRGVIPANISKTLPKDLNDALPEDVKEILPTQN